jgi:hypothetical protein
VIGCSITIATQMIGLLVPTLYGLVAGSKMEALRQEKDKLMLRVPEANDKEREYTVVSMTPRADAPNSRSTAKAASR